MNLVQRLLDRWRNPQDLNRWQRGYRRYLAGVPQAQPYVLSTVREISDTGLPLIGGGDVTVTHVMDGPRAGIYVERDPSRNSPIIGVTIEGRYGEQTRTIEEIQSRALARIVDARRKTRKEGERMTLQPVDESENVPTCDICGEPQLCDRGNDCTFHPADWNGETGNHESCEATNTEVFPGVWVKNDDLNADDQPPIGTDPSEVYP